MVFFDPRAQTSFSSPLIGGWSVVAADLAHNSWLIQESMFVLGVYQTSSYDDIGPDADRNTSLADVPSNGVGDWPHIG